MLLTIKCKMIMYHNFYCKHCKIIFYSKFYFLVYYILFMNIEILYLFTPCIVILVFYVIEGYIFAIFYLSHLLSFFLSFSCASFFYVINRNVQFTYVYLRSFIFVYSFCQWYNLPMYIQGSHSPSIPWKTLGFNYWFYKRLKTLSN